MTENLGKDSGLLALLPSAIPALLGDHRMSSFEWTSWLSMSVVVSVNYVSQKL